jgi:hypothetical protein
MSDDSTPAWHKRFLDMLPAIRRQAHFAFHDLTPQSREDAVDEVIGLALVAFVQLVERGKAKQAYPSPLAQYAIRHVRAGREVGTRLNVRDVASRYAQQQRGFQLQRLDHFDSEEGAWMEALVEDKRATPADTAASRTDFAAWLKMLSPRRRRMANFLAIGETTNRAARRFHVSPARISQIRRELQQSWDRFHGQSQAASRQRV